MIVPSCKHFLDITKNMTPVKCLKPLYSYFIYRTKIYNLYYKKYILALVRNIH